MSRCWRIICKKEQGGPQSPLPLAERGLWFFVGNVGKEDGGTSGKEGRKGRDSSREVRKERAHLENRNGDIWCRMTKNGGFFPKKI